MTDSGAPKRRMSQRVLAGLVLIAVCALGVAAGVALDRVCLRQHVTLDGFFRNRPAHWARSDDDRRGHWSRLAKRLGLTPEQAVTIDSILAQQGRQLRDTREEIDPQMRSIMRMTKQRIDSTLTPDQRRLLQRLRREREVGRERR
jgi:Spy/CpxP family protein refolding chaperone